MKKSEFYDQITGWYHQYSELSKSAVTNNLDELLAKNIELLTEKDAKELLLYHLRRHVLQQFIEPIFKPVEIPNDE